MINVGEITQTRCLALSTYAIRGIIRRLILPFGVSFRLTLHFMPKGAS
jgi:hypothetical protein